MSNIKISQKTLNEEEKITLDLLEMVEENSAITQRSLAAELNVALGLTNSYVKRCAKKGLIKVKQVPSNRYAYYLTPSGFAEKSRLTAEYLKQSFNFFRMAKGQSHNLLQHCVDQGWARVALVGKSDLTEITILSAVEMRIELVGIIDEETASKTTTYMNLPVVESLSGFSKLDALILTNMSNPQDIYAKTTQLFPKDKILAAPLLGITHVRERKISENHLSSELIE